VAALRSAAAEGSRVEADRSHALAVLAQVERLVCPGDRESAPLAAVLAEAQRLRSRPDSSDVARLPQEARGLLDRTHVFFAVLGLTRADENTTDARWGDWYDAIESAVGTPLVVAIARKRIVLDASHEAATS
jgi:hypothetical protein